MEFLLDENVLGLGRYLDIFELKYRKIGGENCPPLKSSDSAVAKFADAENLVVVTNNDLEEFFGEMDEEFETLESIIKNALEIVDVYEKQVELSNLKLQN